MNTKGIKVLLVAIMMTLIGFVSIMVDTSVHGASVENIRVKVDGMFIYFDDVQPLRVDERILVPVRGVFEHLGFIINWLPEARMATLSAPGFFITIPATGVNFQINDKIITPDVPQMMINGRLMLPLRAVAEAVGGTVQWDADNRIAVITTAGNNPAAISIPITNTVPTTPSTPAQAIENNPTHVPYNENVPVLFDGLTLLTSEEILILAESAPSHINTHSATILTYQRMTNAQLDAWIEEYQQLGGINAYELEIIRLINEYRAVHGLNPLSISIELNMAARFHSQEMIALDYLAHISPVHGWPGERAAMFGHANITPGHYGVSENISRGASITDSPNIRGWLNSPGHRAAILRDEATSIGVGVTTCSTGRTGRITAKFGF